MTEKRFVFDPSIYHFTDTATDKTYCEYNLDKVVDLLNSLSDENEQLKNSNEGEIRELESEISAYKELIRDLKREISVRDDIIANVEKAISGD